VGNWSSRAYRAGEKAGLAAIDAALDVDLVYREAKKNVRATP
jgi:hypothetical protein